MAQQQQRHDYTAADANDIEIAPGIVTNPTRRRGKPTLAGSRITVEEVMRKLAAGRSVDDILASWPHLTREQVLAAIEYAHQLVANSAGVDFHLNIEPLEMGDDDEGGQQA
jgi:uncharacterized protein (DUF433 family)